MLSNCVSMSLNRLPLIPILVYLLRFLTSASSHVPQMAQQVVVTAGFNTLWITILCIYIPCEECYILFHPVASDDYTAVNFLNEPFRNRPFNTDNRRQCFNVDITDNNVPENTERFTVTISNSVLSTAVIVDPDVVTITILDRDERPSSTPPGKWDYRRDDGI